MRVQKPVGNFIRAVLLMPLYVPLFAPKAYSSATASHVYTIVLKVQARCLSTSCKHALPHVLFPHHRRAYACAARGRSSFYAL